MKKNVLSVVCFVAGIIIGAFISAVLVTKKHGGVIGFGFGHGRHTHIITF